MIVKYVKLTYKTTRMKYYSNPLIFKACIINVLVSKFLLPKTVQPKNKRTCNTTYYLH